MSTGAWISQREAAFVLQCGSGITQRQARRVLAAGLGGEPRRLAAFHLYAADRVHELAARAELSEAELDSACPQGLFVARRDASRGLDPRGMALAHGWRFSPWTCVWITARIERHGYLPMAVAVAGFVVAGADIVAASTSGTLTLTEPGTWFASVANRRLSTGPGRDWWIRGLDRMRPVSRPECGPQEPR